MDLPRHLKIGVVSVSSLSWDSLLETKPVFREVKNIIPCPNISKDKYALALTVRKLYFYKPRIPVNAQDAALKHEASCP